MRFAAATSLLVFPSLSFALNFTDGLKRDAELESRLASIQCRASWYMVTEPWLSTKKEDLKRLETEVFQGWQNNQLTSEGVRHAQQFLSAISQSADCSAYSGIDERMQSEIGALQTRLVRQLIKQDLLPTVFLSQTGRNVGLLAANITSMTERQRLQYFTILFGDKSNSLGSTDFGRVVLGTLNIGSIKTETLNSVPGLWTATRNAENRFQSWDGQQLPLMKLRKALVRIEIIEEIAAGLQAVLDGRSLDEFFENYSAEINLLNEAKPGLLPKIIEGYLAARARSLPSLNISSLSAEARRAYNGYSRNASRLGSSGLRAGGSGGGSVSQKLLSRWESEELLRLLDEKSADASRVSSAYFNGLNTRIQVYKSTRLTAINELSNDVATLAKICSAAQEKRNTLVYEACVQTFKQVFKVLEDVAKSDKDVRYLLEAWLDSSASFLEILDPKSLASRARLAAIEPALLKLSKLIKSGESPLKQTPVLRDLLTNAEITELQAQSSRIQENQRMIRLERGNGAVIELPFDEAGATLKILDEPLSKMLSNLDVEKNARWLVLRAPIQLISENSEDSRKIQIVELIVKGKCSTEALILEYLSEQAGVARMEDQFSRFRIVKGKYVLKICLGVVPDMADETTLNQKELGQLSLADERRSLGEIYFQPHTNLRDYSFGNSKKVVEIESTWESLILLNRVMHQTTGTPLIMVGYPDLSEKTLSERAVLKGREISINTYRGFRLSITEADVREQKLRDVYLMVKDLGK